MRKFLFLLAAVVFATAINAQVVDRTKERANQKANDRLDQRVDQGIDKGLDAIEGLFKKKNKNKTSKSGEETNAGETGATNTGGIKSVDSGDIKESYTFDHEMTMEMVEADKKGKQKEAVQYTLLISDNEPILATKMIMEGVSANSIIDMENNQVITLTDQPGMKMGMAIGFDPNEFDQTASQEEMMTPTATGKSREISGYTCYQYTSTNEDGSYEWWVTEEENIQWMGGFAASAKNPAMAKGGMFSGMMVEMIITDKKGKTFTTTITEVKKNQENTLSTSGYRFMNFGFGN